MICGFPNSDTDREQTAKSREKIEDFVKQNHAQLWIQHDYVSGIKRKIAPARGNASLPQDKRAGWDPSTFSRRRLFDGCRPRPRQTWQNALARRTWLRGG
jgi:hypothetical protein